MKEDTLSWEEVQTSLEKPEKCSEILCFEPAGKQHVRIMCWELPSVGPGEVPEVGAALWNSSEICLQGWYHWIWLKVSTTWALTIECCLTKQGRSITGTRKTGCILSQCPVLIELKSSQLTRGVCFSITTRAVKVGLGLRVNEPTTGTVTQGAGWGTPLLGTCQPPVSHCSSLDFRPSRRVAWLLSIMFELFFMVFFFVCLFMFKLNLVFFPVTLRASLLRLKSLKLITLFSIFCC